MVEPETLHLKDELENIPIQTAAVRQVPLAWQKEVEDMTTDLLKRRIIKRNNSLTVWISPSQFITKKNGKLRFITN